MALDFRNIDLVLRRGFNAAKDANTLDAELTTLQNAEFVGSNVVAKRPGYSSVSLGTPTVSGAFALLQGTPQGSLIGLGEDTASGPMVVDRYAEGTTLVPVTAGADARTNFGALRRVVSTPPATGLFAGNQHRYFDLAVIGDKLAVCWSYEDLAGTWPLYIAVFDLTAQEWVAQPIQVTSSAAGGNSVRVTALSDRFFVTYRSNAGSDTWKTISTAGAALSSGTLSLTGGSFSLSPYDVCKRSGSDTVYLAFGKAGNTYVSEINTSGTEVGTATWARTGDVGCHVFQFAGGNIGVVANDGTDTRMRVLTTAFATVATTGALSGTGANDGAITSADEGSDRRVYVAATGANASSLRSYLCTAAGVVSSSANAVPYQTLRSRATTIRGEHVVVVGPGDYSTGTDTANAVLAAPYSGNSAYRVRPVALLQEAAFRPTNGWHLPTGGSYGTATYFAAWGDRNEVVVFGYDTAAKNNAVHTAAGAVVAGACPWLVTPLTSAELGFVSAPEIIAATASAGGSMTAGSVVLYATYEWADDLGRRWESAPSDPVTVAVTGSQHVATTITRLTTTAKTGVRVVLWRTTADGTVAYRDTEGSNDGTGAVSLTAGDSSDTTVSGNEILYTMGGVLDNTPFPACEHVALHNERLFFSRCLDTQRVYYTQVLGAAEGWRGSKDYLFTDVADRVVGTASMDDKLVVLAENRPHIVTGQGPNNLGLDNSFFLQPVQEAVQADYAYPRAILSSSMGVWFKSERGLRCLSRGLSLARLGDGQFVGAETDSLVTACVAAVAHPTRPQLWFFVGTGAVAVFDYQWAQWSEFSNFACTHACTYGDSIAFCTSSGTIFQTDTAVWKDNGSAITATIETGWAHVAGIHGFQRIRRAFFTAQDLANAGGDIKIEFAYDGSGTYSSTDAPTVTIAASTTSLSYAHHMAQQKCSRMRIKLTLQGSSGSTVGAFRVAGLGIEVGTKRGGPKLSSGQRL